MASIFLSLKTDFDLSALLLIRCAQRLRCCLFCFLHVWGWGTKCFLTKLHFHPRERIRKVPEFQFTYKISSWMIEKTERESETRSQFADFTVAITLSSYSGSTSESLLISSWMIGLSSSSQRVLKKNLLTKNFVRTETDQRIKESYR